MCFITQAATKVSAGPGSVAALLQLMFVCKVKGVLFRGVRIDAAADVCVQWYIHVVGRGLPTVQ
jgi:hypothetical protein